MKSGFAKEHLKSFIERVERLEEERTALTADIREVYAEAKGQGFDTKIMRQVVRLRKMESADRQEQEAMRDLYMSALGMLADTPLGQASITKATVEALHKMPARRKKPLPPHDPETGEVIEPPVPEPAREAAAVEGVETSEALGASSVTDHGSDAQAGPRQSPADAMRQTSDLGVTGGESAAPYTFDAASELPALLRKPLETTHA